MLSRSSVLTIFRFARSSPLWRVSSQHAVPSSIPTSRPRLRPVQHPQRINTHIPTVLRRPPFLNIRSPVTSTPFQPARTADTGYDDIAANIKRPRLLAPPWAPNLHRRRAIHQHAPQHHGSPSRCSAKSDIHAAPISFLASSPASPSFGGPTHLSLNFRAFGAREFKLVRCSHVLCSCIP